nr:hypothetical protein BaRGS_027836 [Batillaria attramentaria]
MNVTSNSVNVTGVSNVTEWPAGEDGYYYDYDYADPCGLHDRGSWLHRIVKPVVYSTGIVGIVLTVVVLSRKTMCTSTNCYLTALAIADLIILLVLSAQIVMEQGIDCQPLQESLLTAIDHVLVIVNNIALFASVWLTVMLAVERYIAICHPLQAMTICTTTRARALIAAIFIIAVIIRAPNFWDFTLRHQRFLTPDNVTMEQAVLEWQQDAYNMPVYTLIVSGIMAGLLPLLALAGLNIRLVVEIRQSTRYLRYHLAADSRIQSVISHEEKKITLMLIFIIFAFFICQCPFMVFHDVALINLAIKSACNFILYCWFSEKFWNTFKQIFCLRHCLPEQPLVRNGHTNGNTNNHRPSCFVTRETTC